MYYTRLIFILFVLIFQLGSSQNNLEVFSQPKVSFNHKVSETYRFNFFITSRQEVYSASNFIFNQIRIELGHFSTIKITPKFDFSLGLQYTNESLFEDLKDNEIRITEQLNFKTNKNSLRIGHRLRLEQRIYKEEVAYRSRYRTAIDLPLVGQKLDLNETYLVGTSELLHTLINKTKPRLDYRLAAQIGWLKSKKTRLQFGVEHRFTRINSKARHQSFIVSTLITNL